MKQKELCNHENAYLNPTTNAFRCPDCNSIRNIEGDWVKVTEYHIGTKKENDTRLKALERCFLEG